jgi:hypothetical protein
MDVTQLAHERGNQEGHHPRNAQARVSAQSFPGTYTGWFALGTYRPQSCSQCSQILKRHSSLLHQRELGIYVSWPLEAFGTAHFATCDFSQQPLVLHY